MITALKTIWKGMVPENPVFVLALGLCSTLAVTMKVENAFFMSVMVGITTIVFIVFFNLIIYLL